MRPFPRIRSRDLKAGEESPVAECGEERGTGPSISAGKGPEVEMSQASWRTVRRPGQRELDEEEEGGRK